MQHFTFSISLAVLVLLELSRVAGQQARSVGSTVNIDVLNLLYLGLEVAIVHEHEGQVGHKVVNQELQW